MSEIINAIKLKDKVIIASVLAVFAIILAVTVGVITEATIDIHNHTYEYHIERGSDGGLDFVGVCTDIECIDPVSVRDINSGITERVTLAPTCCSKGEKEYSFTSTEDSKTYTYSEEIPATPHAYVGVIVGEGGSADISGSCTNEGCTSPELSVSGAAEIKLESVVDATCHTPKTEIYSYSANGEKGTVSVIVEEYTEHKLNGVFVTELEIADGVYPYGTEGMTLTSAQTLPCGQQGEGSYICEECKKTFSVILSREDHYFVYDESRTVRPTVSENGSAAVRCINDGCTEIISVILPAAVEGVNSTLVKTNHIDKTMTLKYSFVSDEHDFTVEFEFDVYWEEHTFVFADGESIMPTLDSDGEAVIRCSYEGCNESVKLPLAKIQIGENSTVISEATEISRQTVKYVYANEQYGINLELTLEAGAKLSHEYVYNLESENDIVSLVGRCSQPGCQTPVIYDNDAEINYEFFEATCHEYARKVWSCERNGESYVLTVTLTEDGLSAHAFEYSEKDTVYPNIDREGKAYVRCTNEGCTEFVIVKLPKVEEGVNAETETDLDVGIKEFKYTYVCEEYGFTVTHSFAIVVEHLHNYEYTLKRVNGEFVLFGICNKIPCNFNSTVSIIVEPVLISNTTTCISLGKLTWAYVHEGEVYSYSEDSSYFAPHSYELVESEDPTVYKNGTATIRCTFEECGQVANLTLPRVVEGVNATFERVEQDIKTLKYSYYFEEHGYTYETEVHVVIPHTHDYAYSLVKENGSFLLVGNCQKPALCPAVRISKPVEALLVNDSSTCTTLGKLTWSYTEDGIVYTCEEDATEYAPHSFEYVDIETVMPSFEESGSAILICTAENCGTNINVTLPKVVIDGNTEILNVNETTGLHKLRYTHHVAEQDIDIVLEFSCLVNHTHSYYYELMPSNNGLGRFDFVGICSNPDCLHEEREEDVTVVLVSNTSTCVQLGKQVWTYDFNGETYTCQTEFPIFADHTPEYDESADNTILPGIESEGYIAIVCDECGTVIEEVTLPAIELDVNATILTEDEEKTVYEYSYTTEGGVTVELTITVLK